MLSTVNLALEVSEGCYRVGRHQIPTACGVEGIHQHAVMILHFLPPGLRIPTMSAGTLLLSSQKHLFARQLPQLLLYNNNTPRRFYCNQESFFHFFEYIVRRIIFWMRPIREVILPEEKLKKEEAASPVDSSSWSEPFVGGAKN